MGRLRVWLLVVAVLALVVAGGVRLGFLRDVPEGYIYDWKEDLLCPSPDGERYSFQSVTHESGGIGEERARRHYEGLGYETVSRSYGFAVPYSEFPGFYRLTYHSVFNGHTISCQDMELW